MRYKINGIKSSEVEFRRSMLNFVASVEWTEAKRLQFLNNMLGPELEESHNRTQERIIYLRKFLPVEQGGCVEVTTYFDYSQSGAPEVTGPAIALVESGCDCDGSQYSGDVTILDATGSAKLVQFALEQEMDDRYKWADGPMYFSIMKPSEAMKLKRQSRDLTMEAFEDGHSHSISSARYDEDGDYNV